MTEHKIVSRAEWRAARDELQAREKEHTRMGDELARITVEAGAETFRAVAQELDTAARAELWPTLVAAYPTLASHQAKTTRQFPVLILTRER